jgi:hypothetical protein
MTFTLLKPVIAGTKTRYYTGKTSLQERKSVLPTTYTPDFVLDTGNQLFVIECKGFPNDAYPIKRKLFLEYLSKLEKPSYFIEAKNESQIIAILALIKKALSNNE